MSDFKEPPYYLLQPLCSEEAEVAKFTESIYGNPMLLDKDGYSFKMNLKRGEKIYWGCSAVVNW